MASTIQVDKITDIGGNTIIESNGSGTFTSNLPASAPNVSTATGTLPIANGGTGAATLAAAGLTNTPNFRATLSAQSATLSGGTWTKISPNTEAYDSDSAYTGGTFTVPSGKGGLYFIYANAYFSHTSVLRPQIAFYVNGSRVYTRGLYDENVNVAGYPEVVAMAVLNLSATNTVEFYVRTSGGDVEIYGDSNLANHPATFGAYKLIGA